MPLLGKNGHHNMHGTQRKHFNITTQKVGCASTTEPVIGELLARPPAAIAEVNAELQQGSSQRVRDATVRNAP